MKVIEQYLVEFNYVLKDKIGRDLRDLVRLVYFLALGGLAAYGLAWNIFSETYSRAIFTITWGLVYTGFYEKCYHLNPAHQSKTSSRSLRSVLPYVSAPFFTGALWALSCLPSAKTPKDLIFFGGIILGASLNILCVLAELREKLQRYNQAQNVILGLLPYRLGEPGRQDTETWKMYDEYMKPYYGGTTEGDEKTTCKDVKPGSETR